MIRREPPSTRVLQDLVRVITIGTLATAILAVLIHLPRVQPGWLDLIGRALAVPLAHGLTTLILREIVPRPIVGSHRVGEDPGYTRWVTSNALSSALNHGLVRWPFSFLDTTRFLYLRAQRARVAVDASIHASVRIAEPCLLSVESGAQLEPGVIIENALHATGRVRIDAVFIGAGCLIGAHAMLMPGVSLGHEARVSPGSYLGPDVSIGVGAKIGERAILAAAVDVGSHARIGAGAVIGEGVVIGEHARVAAGAVIPPKSQIREGEVWQGVPARPMNRDVRGRPRDSS